MNARQLMNLLAEMDPDERVVIYDRSGVFEHECSIVDVEQTVKDGVMLVIEVAEEVMP